MKSNKNDALSILFICKADDYFSVQAAAFITDHFPKATIVYSARQQPFPDNLLGWEGDLIISYLSQWIIPAKLLKQARLAALNFHPGPPAYPGIGCTNFAIYQQADEFGVTCHHMEPAVDTGAIVAVQTFPVFETDSVYSITQRCYSHILSVFYDVFYKIMNGEEIPVSNQKWLRKPYLRKELNELCRLTPDMDIKEIERRIKATTYQQPWAYMEIGGKIFKLTEEDIRSKKYINYL